MILVLSGRSFPWELIDTLWNVNIMDGKYFSVIKKELIDTLWNVNQNLGFLEISTVPELIDTLWNVNQPGKRDGVKWGRINRYIMECKYPI